jgi:hypothetical protein
VQPRSIWLWLSQLIRRVELSDKPYPKGAQGARVEWVYPGSFGVAAFAKVLTTREGYGPLRCCNCSGLLVFYIPL